MQESVQLQSTTVCHYPSITKFPESSFHFPSAVVRCRPSGDANANRCQILLTGSDASLTVTKYFRLAAASFPAAVRQVSSSEARQTTNMYMVYLYICMYLFSPEPCIRKSCANW